tara:strand:+ start:58 stop:585 length:528 start_codon:yes stop_codon:yes gene_type:complete
MAQKDNAFFDFFKWLIRPFDWPKSTYQELKDWYIMKNVCKEVGIQQMFKKNDPEIRYDKLYRLYTVINIPEELYDKQHEQARQTFLIDQLRKIDEFTVSLGISEILYPEYNIITDVPDSFAYLLTLETDKESLTIWKFLGWILKLSIWTIIYLAINSIIFNTTGNSIIGWISSLI